MQSRANTPAPSERADEDRPSTSSTGDRTTETTSSQPTTTGNECEAEAKAARHGPPATSPASSRGSSKTRTSPGNLQKHATDVSGVKATKQRLRQRLGRDRPRGGSGHKRGPRCSSRQPLITPRNAGRTILDIEL
ncbi:hypothetical protein MRX96_040206 [Rhipicephalus microplus]